MKKLLIVLLTVASITSAQGRCCCNCRHNYKNPNDQLHTKRIISEVSMEFPKQPVRDGNQIAQKKETIITQEIVESSDMHHSHHAAHSDFSRKVQDVKEDAKSVTQTVVAAVKDTTDRVIHSPIVEKTKAKVVQTAEAIKDGTVAAAHTVQEKAHDFGQATREKAHELKEATQDKASTFKQDAIHAGKVAKKAAINTGSALKDGAVAVGSDLYDTGKNIVVGLRDAKDNPE